MDEALISAPEHARQLGMNGKEHVRTYFLLTRCIRYIKDGLALFVSLFYKGVVGYL